MDELPVLAADTTFARMPGQLAYSHLVHWHDEHDEPPVVGQHVMAAYSDDNDRLESVIAGIRSDDGVIILAFPQFVKNPPRLDVDLNVVGDSRTIQTRAPRSLFGQLRVGSVVAVPGDLSPSRLFVVTVLSNGDRDVSMVAV